LRSIVENLATWAHELIHAADDRLGNMIETGQHFRSEIVAEMGGAVLLYAMGYKKDADLDVIERTCQAVALILEESDKQLSLPSDSIVAVDVAA